MTLREQVGQLMIVGVEGPELSPIERAWIRLIQPGGIILFRRNIEQPSQVTALLRDATLLAGAPLFRCVDLEGGLVDRLRDLIAPMPSAAAVYASAKRRNFVAHGRLIAREAKALGFNITFAPVLDLALPASASVMKTRVVSADPSDVVAYAGALLDGLDSVGVLACGKHFPGLGGGALDSHVALPKIARTWDQLWTEDLAAFRALAPRLPMIMVAHAAYPRAKDPTPASVSKFWIASVLRKRIGFRGLIISDDTEMGGILTQLPIEDAAIKAILAGSDLIEICRDPALILRAYQALLAEAERSAAFRRQIQTAARRVAAFKARRLPSKFPPPASPAQLEKLRADIHRFSAEIE